MLLTHHEVYLGEVSLLEATLVMLIDQVSDCSSWNYGFAVRDSFCCAHYSWKSEHSLSVETLASVGQIVT